MPLALRTSHRRREVNKSVPTLLGILIILVVVVLVVLIYNIKLTNQLATGGTPTGTLGGQILTGEKAPTTMLPPAGPRGQNKPEALPQGSHRGEPAQRRGGEGTARGGQRRGEAARSGQ
jgi:hypothetical protein